MGYGKDQSSPSDHGSYLADKEETTGLLESAEELCRPTPIRVGVSGQRYSAPKGLTLEGYDTLHEEGEIGSPVRWTFSGDFQHWQRWLTGWIFRASSVKSITLSMSSSCESVCWTAR